MSKLTHQAMSHVVPMALFNKHIIFSEDYHLDFAMELAAPLWDYLLSVYAKFPENLAFYILLIGTCIYLAVGKKCYFFGKFFAYAKSVIPNYPAGKYMFKVNNRNTRPRCEIWSKLTIKTLEWLHWPFKQVNADWVSV